MSRLIDAYKLMADDTFCEGIECDMCSLSYIDDVYHCRACGVTKWIINQPTVCDIDAIRQEIEKVFCISVITNELRTPMEVKAEILQIIDKYKAESEE